MGRSHALTGAMVFGLCAPAAAQVAHLAPAELVLGIAATAGFAVLSDIDHPNSGISMTFGPATRGFSALVRWMSGGHRNGTHSFLGAAVVTFAAFGGNAMYTADAIWLAVGAGLACILTGLGIITAATDTGRGRGAPAYKKPWYGPAALLTAVAIAAGFGAALAVFGTVAGTVVLAGLMVLALAALIRLWHIKGLWDDFAPLPITWALMHWHVDLRVIPFAALLGILTHIAGDMITPGGCPLGWPWSQTMRGVDFIEVNGTGEIRVFVVCAVVFAGALLVTFGPLGVPVAVLPFLAPRPKRREPADSGGGNAGRGRRAPARPRRR